MMRSRQSSVTSFSRFLNCPAALRWLTIALLCWSSTALLSPLQAQMAPAAAKSAPTVQIPDHLTHDQVRDLVARLSDAEVRELIISQLDKQAIAESKISDTEVYVSHLHNGVIIAWSALSRLFTSGSGIDSLPATIINELTYNGRVSGVYLLFQFIGLLAVGWLGAHLTRRLLNKNKARQGATSSLRKRFDLACYSLVRGLIELGGFAGGAALVVVISSRQMPAAHPFWFELIWCLVLIQLVVLAVKMVTRPAQAQIGLLPVSTDAAQQALAWTMLLTATLVLPQPVIAVATDYGADSDTALLLSLIFGGIFLGLLIVLLIRLRNYGSQLIIGEETGASSLRLAMARIWWILAIGYVLAIWFLSVGKRAATGESSMVPGIGSLMLFALIPFFDRGLQALVSWYFSDKPEPQDSAEAAETDSPADDEKVAEAISSGANTTSAPGYIATALRYARTIMALVIVLVFVRLWNINLEAIAAQLIGPTFANALFAIGITVLLTWAMWGIIRISIERKLDDGKSDNAEEGESEAGGLGGSRVETVLPLIRVSIKITLIVMAVLISLSSLGVNIGPLIAGAGVVGIAIGFGAQTLVRDIVSGFFYLLDDAFRIGEYVVIDQIRGTVEKISVRSFQLRHHEGPVHTIPYGEIRTLTNWSRDWAIMKFELRVPFETDIDMVRKMIKQIGLDMINDPVFGPLMLAPLKSQGVNRIDDSALIIRCKFTAIPGQQYLIRREAFTRIQRVFEEKGIQFAPRRVLVEATTPAEAVNAAAAAIDQEKPADASKPPPM
jgi:small-conductance mechanosensitive channel